MQRKKSSLKKSRKISKYPKNYKILDNGGIPFKVRVSSNVATVFKMDLTVKNVDKYEDKHILKFTFKKIFVGEKGHSLLLKIKQGHYVSIGESIFEFKTKDLEDIVSFKGRIGNSGVVYAFCKSLKFVYLLGFRDDRVYAKLEDGPFNTDPYQSYYFDKDAKKHFKKLKNKTLQKRLFS
jgi:hypothetical protein